ncbi:unnamed protein product, partial [Mesorhabditis belari]|uniref:Uncharacterized protein n=1 Tax=Mesorhabditis belari TaxID=2138241 RepID=A0AAF3EXX7_9BILA
MIDYLLIFAVFPMIFADLDFSLQCQKGYRVTAIRRIKNAYSILGSLSIECEPISEAATTSCDSLTKSPQCNGGIEGCTGNSWLSGFKAYLVENETQATILDPICCSSPSVTIDPISCINDQINMPKRSFSHSIVSDLTYRGVQCWHQYDAESRLVDLIWKVEICGFQSRSVNENLSSCSECKCECGIRQCGDGREPIRVVHKRANRLLDASNCSCDCQCTYKCP